MLLRNATMRRPGFIHGFDIRLFATMRCNRLDQRTNLVSIGIRSNQFPFMIFVGLVSYLGFIPRFHTFSCSFGFIPGFIPWFHTPVSYPIVDPGFIPWFHTLVLYFGLILVFIARTLAFCLGRCGVPVSYPVSYRFHTGFIHLVLFSTQFVALERDLDHAHAQRQRSRSCFY